MNPTSNVSVVVGFHTEDQGGWERSQTERSRFERRAYRVQRARRGGFLIDNSSILNDQLRRFLSGVFENSTNPDFAPFINAPRLGMDPDDNVLRIPVVARKRVKIGKVKRLKPLRSE